MKVEALHSKLAYDKRRKKKPVAYGLRGVSTGGYINTTKQLERRSHTPLRGYAGPSFYIILSSSPIQRHPTKYSARSTRHWCTD